MNQPNSDHWIARHSRPVIFLILTLGLLGAYLAVTIPVSVFPSTDFPRVLIAVDNGVMPIDQMMVTVTRPIEEAVNSVPGLLTVRSITSRGSAEVDLYFRWNIDMFQTLQYVNAAISRVQPDLPATAKIEAHRMTFASFPIIGYSLTSDKVPQTQLWEMATYDIKPRLNRLTGVATVIVAGAGNKPEQKSVKTGIREGDDVQITDGLKAGERVVTVGAFELASEDPDVLARTKLEIQAPAKSEEGSGKESGKDSDAPSGKDSDKD